MEIRLPQLGEGADSGTVVSVLVKPGDSVKKNQTLIELESEKAVAPIPSTADGVIQSINVKQGDKISVGQLVAVLGGGAASSSVAKSAAPTLPAAPPVPVVQVSSVPAAQPHQSYASSLPPPASPSVRAIARDLGIDLSRIRGSETGGRIGLADLRNYVAQIQAMSLTSTGPAAAAQPSAQAVKSESIDFSQWGPVTKKPLSSLRRTIARRMHESWNTIPHVTQFDDADVTAISALRKKYAADYEKKGVNLTITAIILKAVVAALKKFPVMNSSLDLERDELVLKDYIHLGVAVDTEQGLIVPVIRDADKKSVFELAKVLGELAEKTRQRKTTSDELRGSTFTISNLGGIGGGHFTPIVNKPEVAILGIGRGVAKPIAREGKIEIRSMMPVCVSYDHRVIDGADGARFTRAFVEAVEAISDADIRLSSLSSGGAAQAVKGKKPVKQGKKAGAK